LKVKKRLKSSRSLWKVIKNFYETGHRYKKEGKPVIWLPPMNGAIEITYAMGAWPLFTENWSPVCSSMKITGRTFPEAEKAGYAKELCGYLRNSVGYVSSIISDNDNLPYKGMAKPDLILTFGSGCIPAMKIAQISAYTLGTPVFFADMPQVGKEDITDYHIKYIKTQLENYIDFLEQKFSLKYDEEKLVQAVNYSDKACALWDEIMSYRSIIPTPFSAAEIGIMFVMVTMQGTKDAVDFLTLVRDEVRENVEKGTSVIENEKFRLFWDNIPLWYNLPLLKYPEKSGGVIVAETYSIAWSFRLDPKNPLESLALKSLLSFPDVSSISLKNRSDLVVDACRRYHIDGIIFHSNRSCQPISLGQEYIKDRVENELGIPSVMFDACHMDSSLYNEGQIKVRLEAFFEMILANKK
jgi:benzoyl-CoA reductase/2-hydroxyglutaryl-CoA dehydratase subunit BcrC/BadD/HgdB